MSNVEHPRPSVSVVLPTWNSGEYLASTLDSILGQTQTDFELIVVDSNSDDGTREYLEQRSDSRMRIFDLPMKCGVSMPRNLGSLAARGEFLAIMDHDDLMHPQRLEKQVAFLRANPQVHILGTDFVLTHRGKRSRRRQPAGDALIKARLLHVNGNALHNPTIMLRRDFLEAHRLSYPQLAIDSDHALWAKCVRAHAIFANLGEVLLEYRYHETSLSRVELGVIELDKTPIREELVGAFLPSLSGAECAAIAALMEKDRVQNDEERRLGVEAIDRAMAVNESAYGVDLATLKGILKQCKIAALRSMG